MTTIEGPLGPFIIPETDDPRTLMACKWITDGVFAGEYEHPELPLNIRTILDIGGGWGAFAVWARAKWGDGISVIAYEPHEAAAVYHEKNAPWTALIRMAVTTQPAPRLFADADWGGAKTHRQTEGVPVTPRHPSALPKVDLLKCDAEGVEAEILEHYPYLPELKALIYEFHSPELREECRAIAARRCPTFRQVFEEKARDYGVSIWLP